MEIRMYAGAFALLACGVAAPAASLTENEAVERALARPAVQALRAGAADAAAGDVIEARAYPNPVFEFERQRLGGSPGERETTFGLSQRFDLGGKRALRLDAANARLASSDADADARRNTLQAEVRRRFHEALAGQRFLEAHAAWEMRLAQAEALAEKLEKGGEVAGFDRRRVARERAGARARLNALRADLERAVEALAALIGWPADQPLALVGNLAPGAPGSLETYVGRVEVRPDLTALAARASAFALDEAAARRTRIPDVTLGAGVKQLERGMQDESGLVFTLSVPLPIFERGEGAQRRAAGQARLAAGERDLALAKAHGDVRGLWKQAQGLLAAARQFRAEGVEGSRRLAEIAGAAYRGGETGILELLDAHRGLAEAEMRALELELSARLAQIELELVSGGRP